MITLVAFLLGLPIVIPFLLCLFVIAVLVRAIQFVVNR